MDSIEHFGIYKRTSFEKAGKQGSQEAFGIVKKSEDCQDAQIIQKAVHEKEYQEAG